MGADAIKSIVLLHNLSMELFPGKLLTYIRCLFIIHKFNIFTDGIFYFVNIFQLTVTAPIHLGNVADGTLSIQV